MEVDGFSKRNELVPTLDPDYVFDAPTTLAILNGFSHSKKVLYMEISALVNLPI